MKVGIVCDDYKVEMFKQELEAAGIVYIVSDNHGEFVAITCLTAKPEKVQAIVEKVTKHFEDGENLKTKQ